MLAAFMRLTAFLALLAMPFGMAAAPASAHVASPAASESGHCGQQQGAPEAPANQTAHCAVCAALPAAPLPTLGSLLPMTPLTTALIAQFDGIELDIATPPPKQG